MNKRLFICIAMIFLISAFFSACTQETKIDRYEFSLRLEKTDENYSINPNNIVIENEKQHIFFSLNSSDDCLLTLYIDKTDRIEKISITIAKENWSEGGFADSFLPFCKTAIKAFCLNGESIADEVINGFGLDKSGIYFSDTHEKLENSGYEFTLFSNENSVIIECGIISLSAAEAESASNF